MWSSKFARVIKRFFDAAKAKSNIGLQLLWQPEKMGREGQVKYLPDFNYFDSGTVPIWKWEMTIWILSFRCAKTKWQVV